MRLLNDNSLLYLEHILASVLGGMSLKKWAENTTFQLLRSTGEYRPPVKFSENLLQARGIIGTAYKKKVPGGGRLITDKQGFIVELPERCTLPHPWGRFFLAHEIGHTFFYDVRERPPLQLIHLEVGNRSLEWLCDYLATCLLIPVEWLNNQIRRCPPPGSQNFSLIVLRRLARTFLVPLEIIAKRIIEDLGVWNCIILKFKWEQEPPEFPEEEWKPGWRLRGQNIPLKGTDELSIPIGGRTRAGVMKYPRAKGRLTSFIEECAQEGEKTPFFHRTVQYHSLKCSATGNLSKFLRKHSRADEIPVYIMVNKTRENTSRQQTAAQKSISSVFMCFSLSIG